MQYSKFSTFPVTLAYEAGKDVMLVVDLLRSGVLYAQGSFNAGAGSSGDAEITVTYSQDGYVGESTLKAWMVEKEWWDKLGASQANAMELTSKEIPIVIGTEDSAIFTIDSNMCPAATEKDIPPMLVAALVVLSLLVVVLIGVLVYHYGYKVGHSKKQGLAQEDAEQGRGSFVPMRVTREALKHPEISKSETQVKQGGRA